MPDIVENFHNSVEQIDPVWIDMPDGVRLAARLWLPAVSKDEPVPAMLEYIPYRRRDGTAVRDAMHHPYLAGHGIACIRVDMRGSGDSDGFMADEYIGLEQDDAETIIEWIAAQDWCNGNVAMMGISWGGFSALQAAYRRPPALKAIVPVAFTHDRYAVDIHYKGGALLVDNFSWAATMLSYNARPPDPAIRDDWRGLWLARLEQHGHFLEHWLEHQHRDALWAHGSVCEDYGRIETPILAAAGWLDTYSEAVAPLHNGVSVPVRSLVGPWGHKYPHLEIPKPGVGFLKDIVGWCRRWLADEENGIEDNLPPFRIFVMEPFPPDRNNTQVPGAWIQCESWPPPESEQRTLHLTSAGGLGDEAGAGEARVSSPEWVGSNAGELFPMNGGTDLPGDQRDEDAGSVCFDTEMLDRDLTILGAARLTLRLSSDVPRANLIARLCAVAPNGRSHRITYSVLNLAAREDVSNPTPMVPGDAYDIDLKLDDIAYRVPQGYRLRLALSTAYFPLIWPQPWKPDLRIDLSTAILRVPAANGRLWDYLAEPAEASPPLEVAYLEEPGESRNMVRERPSGRRITEIIRDDGLVRNPELDLVHGTRTEFTYSIEPDDPLSAVAESHWIQRLMSAGVACKTITRTRLSATETDFLVQARLEAHIDGDVVFERDYERTVPRLSV